MPGLERVCGVPVPEDLVHVPGSRWIVASSMPGDGSPGGLFLIDTRERRAERLPLVARGSFASSLAEERAVARCTPPDPAKFVTHGLSLSNGGGGIHRLYVVAHGGREAIELFNVDARGDRPILRWTGCVPLPDGLEANSVVGLPEGGLIFTSLYDRDDHAWKSRIGKLAAAAPAGGIYEWHAGSGVRKIDIPPVSGPNGIAVSEDGQTLFVAGWGDRIVRRLDRNGKETAPALHLDFLPDNLHWAPDGTLLAAGQKIAVGELFSCISAGKGRPYCTQTWSVARIGAADLALRGAWQQSGDNAFGDSTSAIIVDGRLWIGAIKGDCIATVDVTSVDRPTPTKETAR